MNRVLSVVLCAAGMGQLSHVRGLQAQQRADGAAPTAPPTENEEAAGRLLFGGQANPPATSAEERALASLAARLQVARDDEYATIAERAIARGLQAYRIAHRWQVERQPTAQRADGEDPADAESVRVTREKEAAQARSLLEAEVLLSERLIARERARSSLRATQRAAVQAEQEVQQLQLQLARLREAVAEPSVADASRSGAAP